MPFTLDGNWIPKSPDLSTNSKGSPPKSGVKVREVKRKKALLTVILNLDPSKYNLNEIARELKQKLGVGGAIKDGAIELQGFHQKDVIEILLKRGIKAS